MNVVIQINIGTCYICQCGGCPVRCKTNHDGSFRSTTHYPRYTWDRPRLASSGADSPSVMGSDDGSGR